MSVLKNLFLDASEFAYQVAFHKGFVDEIRRIYNHLRENNKIEEMRALVLEYGERIGSIQEAAKIFGVAMDQIKDLENEWERKPAIGDTPQEAYIDGEITGAEYANYMAMYACRSRYISYSSPSCDSVGYAEYEKEPYYIPRY